MKYIIELREDNTILRVAKIRPKTEVLSNKGSKQLTPYLLTQKK